MDNNPEIEVQRSLGGGELTFFSRVHYGGGAACAPIAAGRDGGRDRRRRRSSSCYRAMNERSDFRFGTGMQGAPTIPTTENAHYGWYIPFGLLTPASWVAMHARRYMHEYGATSEDFGRVAVAARRHAATNPAAWFYEQPITLEDHQRSRWIVRAAAPARLLPGERRRGGARRDQPRARARPAPEAGADRGAAQGAAHEQHMMTSYYGEHISGLPEMGVVARQLYAMAGLGPGDIQTAVLYDHFTPFVLTQLEEFGFCGRGEAKDFVRDGNIELGGRLPINTNGGQLGEAYIHGMNGVAEGVRQIRGTLGQPGRGRLSRSRDRGNGRADERAGARKGLIRMKELRT